MGFIATIIVGVLAGWLAEKVMKVDINALFLILECFQLSTVGNDVSCRFVIYGLL